MAELIRKRLLNTEMVYTEQAQHIIAQLKDFDYEKFEQEYFNQIAVGDIAISRYLLERKIK